MQPRYPIYIPSKGRWESRATARTLDALGVSYRVCVEPQEYDAYAAVIDPAKLIELPFSNLGRGSIPARNFIWEHAKASGARRHWIMDDNIRGFYRFNHNLKVRVETPATICAMEDFVDRYTNVPMAGPTYIYFLPRRHGDRFPPFILNTRIYSCILLANDVPHRWRGRYNEDTDLSLRFLKDGYCTIEFNAFPTGKAVTMTMRGGNTDELYRREQGFDGRLAMAQELVAQHPDVVRLARKFGRWQHHVDYRPFAGNLPRRRPDLDAAIFDQDLNEYGMQLVDRSSSSESAPERDGDEDETQAEAGAGTASRAGARSSAQVSGAAREPQTAPSERVGTKDSALSRDDADRS